LEYAVRRILLFLFSSCLC